MQRDEYVHAVTLEYGVRFHKYIINPEDVPVTDVNLQHAGFNGLLCTLPTEVHVILGMAALSHVVSKGQHWKLERTGNLKLLEEEIQNGKSLVVMDHNCCLHRRVAITVVQVEKEEQFLLAQLGHFDNDSKRWLPDAKLPGLHQKNNEAPAEAFQRIFQERFQQL
eukprot:4329107-Amphidinium_carterae.1